METIRLFVSYLGFHRPQTELRDVCLATDTVEDLKERLKISLKEVLPLHKSQFCLMLGDQPMDGALSSYNLKPDTTLVFLASCSTCAERKKRKADKQAQKQQQESVENKTIPEEKQPNEWVQVMLSLRFPYAISDNLYHVPRELVDGQAIAKWLEPGMSPVLKFDGCVEPYSWAPKLVAKDLLTEENHQALSWLVHTILLKPLTDESVEHWDPVRLQQFLTQKELCDKRGKKVNCVYPEVYSASNQDWTVDLTIKKDINLRRITGSLFIKLSEY